MMPDRARLRLSFVADKNLFSIYNKYLCHMPSQTVCNQRLRNQDAGSDQTQHLIGDMLIDIDYRDILN